MVCVSSIRSISACQSERSRL